MIFKGVIVREEGRLFVGVGVLVVLQVAHGEDDL